ncbi:hypothetical protein [Actinoplanes xinjiangensis]|uniref:hypothetical protein n=1 Tax=Actinoplanes xinjiangensis TaxID=512350 RepID=UPI0034438213
MKPLSELMQEQIRTDAPPLRHSVDDVVAVGRRRVRRRNSGWTLAAVVAVSAVIGVPQLVSRHPEPIPPPPAATTPAPVPVRGDRIPSTVRFSGYQTASYRVDEPTSFNLGFTSTNVLPRKTTGLDDFFRGATLWVFEPGVDPAARIRLGELTAAEPINGRPAHVFTAAGSGAGLIWEYADGASAILASDPNGPAVDGLREVAEGFRLAAERPVRLAFKVGYLPDGFQLSNVAQDQRFSHAIFLPTEVVRKHLTGLGNRLVGVDLTKGNIQLGLSEISVPGRNPDCDSVACRVLPGGRYQLSISGTLSETDAQKVLDSAVAYTPDDQSTWMPVERAVPERYLPRIG